MRPIALHGHERSVTHIKYNRDGDLLFSSSKDSSPSVWYSINGERLGTYKGHGGAVWCIDVDWTTSKVITGSADNSLRLWDTETGTQLGKYDTRSAVRTCAFSYCGNRVMFSTDKQMGHACEVFFCDIRDSAQLGHNSSYLRIPVDGPKVTSAIWGPLDYYIIAGHEHGTVCQWDSKSGQRLLNVQGHTKAVNDIQPYHDTTMFVTASKDTTAKLFDSESLEHIKTYKTERPVNSASLSSLKHHVVLGGGQEAMDVTTTSSRIGKFDARFFHMVFEEEIGRVKGHFGPINSVAFHPDGKSYSSGGEDGYVRLHQFDPSYFEYEFEY